MGAGYAQVGLLLLLTVVGLPLFFFGLMAALDRFERAISPTPVAPATPEAAAATAPANPEPARTAVLSLPITSAPVATAQLPAAGGAAAVAAGKSAAAI